VIAAFAVSNPNCPSQGRRFFQVWLPVGLPFRADHSAYFGLAKFYLSQPFQPSTEANLESCLRIVNACFQCNWRIAMDQKPETQLIESLSVNESEINSFLFLHRAFTGARIVSPGPLRSASLLFCVQGTLLAVLDDHNFLCC